jgi:hypothetical protein
VLHFVGAWSGFAAYCSSGDFEARYRYAFRDVLFFSFVLLFL